MKKKQIKTKNKVLSITEEEFKRPMIRRAIVDLVLLRAGFHSAEEFLLVSEAELEIMKEVPLFSSINDYKDPKFPNEIGKLRGKRVCLIKE